ncbi:MAG: BatD family protein [Planctomycetes bacterium]|nr:BatD family protein [Planctomycetota bacterium]
MKFVATIHVRPKGEVRDPQGEDHAFVEVTAPRDTYFVEEPIPLTLRFGLDRRFLETSVVPLFGRRMDVPVQLQARWLEQLPGAVSLADESKSRVEGAHLEFALNDSLSVATPAADRTIDRRPFVVFETTKRWLPTRSGDLVIPGPLLRFAFATRFDENFVTGRVPADRHDAFAFGRRLTLHVEPLPEPGRPAGFTGAVGRFTMQASAEPRSLRAGESLKLTLRIEGDGNLAFFEAPGLDSIAGFHVFGRIERTAEAVRTITYDVSPLVTTVREVPSISLAFFDTRDPSGYRTVRTEPIPLDVRGAARDADPKSPGDGPAHATPGVDDIFDIEPVATFSWSGAPRTLTSALLVAGLGAPWILALGLWIWIQMRERERNDPEGVRARAAAATFRMSAGAVGANVAEAYAEFLAARLRCPTASIISPDLRSRLEAAGIPTELAARAAGLCDGLVAARYGSGASALGVESIRRVVDELEAAFQTSKSGR